MTAELAEIIPFPSAETGHPEIDTIISNVIHDQKYEAIRSAVMNAKSDLEAVLAIRSELASFFPQIKQLPAYPDDEDFMACLGQGSATDRALVEGAQTLYIARCIVAALRPHQM